MWIYSGENVEYIKIYGMYLYEIQKNANENEYPKYDIHYGIKKNEINFKYFDIKSN